MFLLGVAQVTELSCRAWEGLSQVGGDIGQPVPLLRAVTAASGAVGSCVRNAMKWDPLQELPGCWEEAQINNSGDREVMVTVPVQMSLCVFNTLHCSPTAFRGCFP